MILKSFYLAFGIAENNCLCDGERIIQVAECVKLPFFPFNGNEELFNSFERQLIAVLNKKYSISI